MAEFDELLRIQSNMATRLHRENELDRKVGLMSLLQGLNPDKKGRILYETIMVEAAAEGFDNAEVQRLLDDLEGDGYLKRVEMGVMMLV